MTIEFMLLSALVGFLFLFLLLQESRINKLNNELNRCFKQLGDKPDLWKHDHLAKTVDRLYEKYEFLKKELNESESKTFKDIDRAKQQMREELNVVYDQLHALANELGYSVSKAPTHYKVTKKD